MKVTYIFHSSFLVETEKNYLLFDYFKGDIPEMDPEKQLVVFVSHRHEDHFSPDIFKLSERYPKTEYVISDDIWEKRVPQELFSKIQFIGPGEELEAAGLKVKAYKSTDEGVAFLIWEGDTCIYHAGDLNNWTWIGEDENWNKQMAVHYHEELDKMAKTEIDLAFVPLDPRLAEMFHLGVDDFMKKVGAKKVFPMHFWEDYTVMKQLKALPCAQDYKDQVYDIHKQGESFEI